MPAAAVGLGVGQQAPAAAPRRASSCACRSECCLPRSASWTPQAVSNRFPEVDPSSPHYITASAAAAGLVLGYAIENASNAAGAVDARGLPTQAAVAAALANLEVGTFYGPVGFDGGSGRNARKPMVVTQVTGDAVLPVYPPGLATADLVYPLGVASGGAGAGPPPSRSGATSVVAFCAAMLAVLLVNLAAW
eukprot:SAG22_NODE_218_length_14885_cov_24.733699_8_plen_192_part_00